MTISYHIGVLLKLSDQLQIAYCTRPDINNRKQSIPPDESIGIQTLSIISETPIDGLLLLRNHLNQPLSWATTITEKNAQSVQKIVTQMEHVSAVIARQTIPEKLSPHDQAQLWLGYLSSV